MKLQRVIPFLVFALPVLIVGFAALLGGSLLARATGDASGALMMARTAGASAILLIMDLVLLVGALGVRAVEEEHERVWRRRRRRRSGRSGDRQGRGEGARKACDDRGPQ